MATIKYGRPSPQLIHILDSQVVEGESQTVQVRFTVQLDAPQDFDLSVSYTTIEQTAIPGVDYEDRLQHTNHPCGSERVVLEVPVLSDDEREDKKLSSLNSANLRREVLPIRWPME